MFLLRKANRSIPTRNSSGSGHVSDLEKGGKWTARYKVWSTPPIKPSQCLGFLWTTRGALGPKRGCRPTWTARCATLSADHSPFGLFLATQCQEALHG